jgi:DNA topoisomerase VI subunit B
MEGNPIMAISQPSHREQGQRETFTTSRLLDFFSEDELAKQTGHQPDDWPLVVVKELIDNGLDACEETGVAPRIEATLGEDHITVSDNGPGIPPEVVAGILDYSVRVSSREAYVEPTRGAQGNALKTLLAMPFVLDGERGRVIVTAQGIRHEITIRVDRIRQEPVIDHETADANGAEGTSITIEWPDKAGFIAENAMARFLQVAQDYAWLNPHMALIVAAGEDQRTYEPTDPEWSKWSPAQATPAVWYTAEDMARLIAASIAKDQETGQDRTVRAFVAGFKGLSSTQKQKRVTETVGLSRSKLSELASGDELDDQRIRALVEAMHAESKTIKPKALGVIGKEHFRQRCEDAGCEMESFNYRKVENADNIPSVVEVAFAAHKGALDPNADAFAAKRRLITGVNWSPGLVNPFRELGELGESLDSLLSDQFAGKREPVLLLVHAACPRVQYADRGKSSVLLKREDAEDES